MAALDDTEGAVKPAFEDAGHVEYQQLDPGEEKKLVRKLDIVLVPMMACVYFFQYLDKQTINYAAIFGLKTDLGLNGEGFSWIVSIFYLGQLCSQWPAAYFMSRLPITQFVGATIIAWGAVEMCLGAPQNFAGMMAVRFFLGFTEGTVSPAFITITSLWYKRSEHTTRVATWTAMNGLSQIVGALITYGIGHGHIDLALWRAIFLITGGATLLCGIVFLLYMPRSPETAWFLNERERQVATQRLATDRGNRERTEFNKAQMKEALLSPMTWMYFAMAFGITLATPIIKFSSTVINGFGFDKYQTMLVGLPSGALNSAGVILSALLPHYLKVKNIRIITGLTVTIIPLIGTVLLMALPLSTPWGLVASTWIAGSIAGPLTITASFIASNVKGNTKKSVVSTGFFICYCIGCLVSPQAWTEQSAPRYRTGVGLSLASLVLLASSYIVYWYDVSRRNRNRDKKAAEGDLRYSTQSQNAEAGVQIGVSLDVDMTDLEDKAFRYSL